jgi:hypothetical protein
LTTVVVDGESRKTSLRLSSLMRKQKRLCSYSMRPPVRRCKLNPVAHAEPGCGWPGSGDSEITLVISTGLQLCWFVPDSWLREMFVDACVNRMLRHYCSRSSVWPPCSKSVEMSPRDGGKCPLTALTCCRCGTTEASQFTLLLLTSRPSPHSLDFNPSNHKLRNGHCWTAIRLTTAVGLRRS